MSTEETLKPKESGFQSSEKTKTPKTPSKKNTATKEKHLNTKKNIGDFFSFRKLISITIIKILYAVGIIPIIIVGICYMRGAREAFEYGLKYGWKYADHEEIVIGIAIGIAIILLGNILWRVLCEGWIVFFNIHNQLDSLKKDNSK
jgi:hypothetical protein